MPQTRLFRSLFVVLVISGCVSAVSNTFAGSSAPANDQSICDVKSFGAVGNGVTKDTRAIQSAIDACAGGHGTVVFSGGRFLSGMISLRSDLTVRLEADATLLGSRDDADYPDTAPPTANSQLHNCRKALVYGESLHNVTITGRGTINGSGNNPRWVGSGRTHPERERPMAVYFTLSDHVTIENIRIRDAAMWTLVTLETDNVVIRGVDIHSEQGPNRDGIDIVDGHHVLIENVTVYSEDDAICLKSGSSRGVDDLIVRNSHVVHSSVAQGLKLGTASTGHFSNVTFENIVIDSVDKAAMAVESVDGAAIDGVIFRNITFQQAGAAFFMILGRRGLPGVIGTIDHVRFENIKGNQTKHAWGSALSGTTVDGIVHAPTNVSFAHVHVTSGGGLSVAPSAPPEYAGQYPDPNLWGNLPASGLYARHVEDLSLVDTTFVVTSRDARPAVVTVDVTGNPLR